ncbi:KN motif and ankyrin repeat domain-containing protein 2 [Parasteatoda tepidariorum]|uniref:KN motif and ankyrin repeat domain-containing protein 2 n=1 Tax=Parasteatoda tepidariorum TaxID=114398 RepID=UPI00077FDE50|nr:KN motif and ankyrin repeat domain-containing protein 1 [Parasteatoda tepidariorum]XP_015915181.1 KN motif and ankyrin repeat domain-containing protein 1 [Parasteatoda tepidariorum]XP_042908173.1 KN motif and ankyrin repeat domain-containing protein 1 [Parasteatoda tepidariorum]XP_042908174.1 KN motif and ankyrin repeat domain-containing protein 1 [Parasteatoda tepidariorum]
MPKKIMNQKMTSKCTCCPYGFHIDLDFVRFCDTLYNTAQLDKLRQQRRERRKEKKSVESYLGIGNLAFHTKENNQILNKTATLPNDFYLHSDGLKDAVIDFEDTWQRSLKKSSSSNDIPKKQNGYHSFYTSSVNNKKEQLFNLVSSKSHSSSTSSVSSQSTTVSNFISTDATNSELISHENITSDNVSKSNKSLGSSVKKSVLTNIRHQMASSLQRLKELEEQVKCIPILEVKLSALKEEKKSLLNQLKFNQSERQTELQKETLLENQRINEICLSVIQKENHLSSPGMASCLDAVISKKCFVEKENSKSVGISCTVLTRDIGVGYIPSKLKSVAVGCDNLTDNKCSSKKSKIYEPYVNLSSESLESDLESFRGSNEQIHPHIPLKSTSSKCSTDKINVPKTYIDSFTSMDIRYVDKSVNTESINNTTKSTPVTTSKFVQTSELKVFRNTSSQTMTDKNTIKKLCCDKAVGNANINDTICSQCKKTNSIAIGDEKLTSCDSPSVAALHVRTVAVGDFDINDMRDNCEHFKSENVQTNSVGINTTNDLVTNSNSDIHICDKCSATIHSVARGLAANTNPLSSSNSNESKIPRSNIRTSPIGRSNSMKLPKLKIPAFQNQKNIENTDSYVSFHSENQNIILKNECETSENMKEIDPKSKTCEILPTLMNLPAAPRKKFEISKEIKAACKVLSDCLQKSDKKSEKKALSSLSIIQTEWFRIANQKNADPLLIEDYLDMFEDFSRLLLERVVNLSDSNGNTALHYAVSYGNFDVVSILIDSKVCDVNKKNKAGYTSIMLVALADMKNDTHQYVVQRLFSIGDINIKATQNGQTALMLAVSHGKKDIAKILIDAGAEVNLQDKDGSTALMCAAEHGHLEIVKFLLSTPDCDPFIVDNDDCNALTVAMEAAHKDIGLLIYTSMNFSRGSSPYSTLKSRKRSTPRSTPPPRTPTLRTPPLPSPSARSTNSIPSSFHFSS